MEKERELDYDESTVWSEIKDLISSTLRELFNKSPEE